MFCCTVGAVQPSIHQVKTMTFDAYKVNVNKSFANNNLLISFSLTQLCLSKLQALL